jgi:hypothetical protein
MKLQIQNHPLEGRQITDGKEVYGIQSVFEMGLEGQKYICLLTWTPGNVPPEYKSHGQVEWENISLDESTLVGKTLLNIINGNKQIYKLI